MHSVYCASFRESLSTCVCVILSLIVFEGGMLDLIVLIADQYLSIYFQ